MAIYNEILAARYARFLQKLFSMKGEVPTKQLSGEIIPVFTFFTGVENRILETWTRFAQWFQIAAGGAGTNGTVRFRNPGNSNTVAVFEKIVFVNLAAANDQAAIQLGPLTTDLTTLITYANQRLDARGGTNPTLIASQQAAAGLGLASGNKLMVAATPGNTADVILFEEQEITLLPGDVLQIIEGGSNQQFTVSCIWRERSLEESERAS